MEFKNKLSIALAAFAASFLGIGFFVVQPLMASIEKSGILITEQKKKALLSESRVAAVREFKAFTKEEEAGFQKMEGIFIDGKMPLDFIGFLETTAGMSGVEIEFSPAISKTEAKGEWPSLGFRISLTGKMNDIFNFISKVEAGRYLTSVESVVVNSAQKNDIPPEKKEKFALGNLEAQVSIKVYAK